MIYGIISIMERIDDLQLKGLRLIQNPALFCFGTDAVLLADFAEVKKGERVADFGTATGVLPLLLYGRQEDASYYGLEIQQALYEIAVRNVALNGLENRVSIFKGDIKAAASVLGRGYDVVVVNPPYEKEKDGLARGSACHRIARKEVLITLDGILAAAGEVLKSGGRLYMIHKASRLPEIFYKMKEQRIEPKILRLVQAREGAEPKYALICGMKDAAEHLIVRPPLVLEDGDGNETQEVMRIYNRERQE
ncbi:MAG: tRNA1(Val) (adenine(37)-N6)-methyltransferase [Christensenellaceae bacterium]|jgi:tRNA1Val (adenine37-N6)-methyltransferase